jgi:hypothetical protein
MKAKEMFEELNYKQFKDVEKIQYYSNEDKITFDIDAENDDTLEISQLQGQHIIILHKAELHAIYKQLQELGWL